MQGDNTKTVTTTLPDLESTSIAVPNTWDSRFKVLIDNDAALTRRVGEMESGVRGVRTLQTIQSVQALRTFQNPNDGEIAYIPQVGLYRFYPGSAEAEALPWVVRPDSNVGRWRLDLVPRSMIGVANGVAGLDAQGFLAQALPNGSVTAEKFAAGAVSAAALGNFVLNDSVTLNVNSATLEQLLGALGNAVKGITGGVTWRSGAPVNLATLNTYAGRTDRPQTWTQRQTMNQLTVTGELILPVV